MKTDTATERPIIFSNAMIPAILEGRKTQTRRVIKGLEHYTPMLHTIDPKKCPYGQPGDRLWVRETWSPSRSSEFSVAYKADGFDPYMESLWKSPIHMPRWASRLLLEITDVRVERLQEISEEDAMKEGDPKQGLIASENTHRDWFKALWNSLHHKDSYTWDTNPWVWVGDIRMV